MQSCFNADSYRCATSLQSELRIVKKLLTLAKKCLCPKLKTYASELEQRRLKLISELKIRAKEENITSNYSESETRFRFVRRAQRT
jgi:16S rRNA C1402 N4-methylase RsmH